MDDVKEVRIEERGTSIMIFRVRINTGINKEFNFVDIRTKVQLVTPEKVASFNRSTTLDKKIGNRRRGADKKRGLIETVFSVD